MATDYSGDTYRELVERQGSLEAFERVRYRTSGGVAWIELDDPASRNAFGPRMTLELRGALDRADADADVRAIVLAGSEGTFSAGGDIRQMREWQAGPLEFHEFVRREFGGVIERIAGTDKPVIAAVDGPAMGVACFTALVCDMVVASERARFGTAYIHLGLTPLGVSYVLAKTLGYVRAYELCALGEVLEADRAHALGLVNRVTAPERLAEEAEAIAVRLAAGPARALGFTKRMLRRALYADLDEHLAHGEAAQPLCLASEDHAEGLAAFTERRAPRFEGR